MKSKTIPITVDLPKTLINRLASRARKNRRTLEREIVAILAEQLPKRGIGLDALVRRIKKLGIRTPDESVEMIREDRDSR